MSDKMLRSGAIYVAALAMTLGVVKVLEMQTGSSIAYMFVTSVSAATLLATLFDFGHTSKFQWAILSWRSAVGHRNGGSDATNRPSTVSYRVLWLAQVYLCSYSLGKQVSVLTGSVGAIMLMVFYWLQYGFGLITLGLILISAISLMFRRVIQVVLEGCGLFSSARLTTLLPQTSLLAVLAIKIFVLKQEVYLDFVLIAFALSNLAVAPFLLAPALDRCGLFSMRAESLTEYAETTSDQWHLLSIMGAVQANIFFVIAPATQIAALTVPIYFSLKMLQAIMELITQFARQWASLRKDYLLSNRDLVKGVFLLIGIILAIPVAITPVATMHSVGLFGTLLLFLYAAASIFGNTIGQVSLTVGGTVPISYLISGGILQFFLTFLAVPAEVVDGFVFAMLVGSLVSLLGNLKSFDLNCSSVEKNT